MPSIPATLCKHTGCNARAVSEGKCRLHTPQDKPSVKQATPHKLKRIDNRPSSTQRGYDSRWRAARLLYLADHPLCEHCLKQGITKGADVVDHIIPHRGDQELFWHQDNWQSLCYSCHSIKTTTVDNKLTAFDIGQLKRGGVGKK